MCVTYSEATLMRRFQLHAEVVFDVGGTTPLKKQQKPQRHGRIHTDAQAGKRRTLVNKMLIGFLFLFLFFSPALSLKCYVCSSTTTNEECNQSNQECQQPLDTCMTVIDTLGSMKAIVKQCTSKAICRGAASAASVDSEGNGNTVACCSGSDFCNFSKADSVHTHITLLSLTAALLALLLR